MKKDYDPDNDPDLEKADEFEQRLKDGERNFGVEYDDDDDEFENDYEYDYEIIKDNEVILPRDLILLEARVTAIDAAMCDLLEKVDALEKFYKENKNLLN